MNTVAHALRFLHCVQRQQCRAGCEEVACHFERAPELLEHGWTVRVVRLQQDIAVKNGVEAGVVEARERRLLHRAHRSGHCTAQAVQLQCSTWSIGGNSAAGIQFVIGSGIVDVNTY